MREGHGFDVWEDMIRVPFVMHAPSRLPARTISALTRQVDVMPTLLDLVGVTPPAHLDGTSLRAAAEGATPPDLHAYTEACGASIADPADWRRGLRTARWKYIETERSAAQLYDLVHDPGERTNVVAQHPDVAAALRLDLAMVTASGDHAGAESRLTDDEEALVSNKLRELGYIE
jgi:arylsulfatase A-like enzyme